MDTKQQFNAASLLTADNLRSIARSMSISQISRLSLPEIDVVVDQVARIIPAGNVPGVILSGLAKLTGRRPSRNVVNRDINLLFRGVEQAIARGVNEPRLVLGVRFEHRLQGDELGAQELGGRRVHEVEHPLERDMNGVVRVSHRGDRRRLPRIGGPAFEGRQEDLVADA